MFFGRALDGVLGMEPEGPGLLVLLLPRFLLAAISVGLAAFPEDVLIELSLEVEDLVEGTLFVVEERTEENFGDTAGFGSTFLEPPNADTLCS